MRDKTIITLARLAVGGSIFITSMITGVNSYYQGFALLLMGMPIEVLAHEKETEKQEKKED